MQEEDRNILFLSRLRRLFLLLDHFCPGDAVGLTHSAAPPRDRDAPRAMTDRVWQATTEREPSPRQPWSRRNPSGPANEKGNKARVRTVQYWSARTRIAGCSQC